MLNHSIPKSNRLGKIKDRKALYFTLKSSNIHGIYMYTAGLIRKQKTKIWTTLKHFNARRLIIFIKSTIHAIYNKSCMKIEI